MLNKIAFAHAIGLVTALMYVVFYVLSLVASAAFELVFNAQFLGADMASLVGEISVAGFIVTLITVTATSWIVGYVLAWAYNRFSK